MQARREYPGSRLSIGTAKTVSITVFAPLLAASGLSR